MKVPYNANNEKLMNNLNNSSNKDRVIDKQFKLIKVLEEARDIQLKKIEDLEQLNKRQDEMLTEYVRRCENLTGRLDEAEENLMMERDIGYDDGYEACMSHIVGAFDVFEDMPDDEAKKILDDILPENYEGGFGPYLQEFCEKCHEWKAEQYNRIHIGDEIIHGGQKHVIIEERQNGDVLAWNLEQNVEITCFHKEDFENGNVFKTGNHYSSIPLEKE